MDQKEIQLFTMMWDLLNQFHCLLGESLPVIAQINSSLSSGIPPSEDQLLAWRTKHRAFDKKLLEVTANLEALRPIADPLFRSDS